MRRFSDDFASPIADFVSFVLWFGWEGPVAFALGLKAHAVVLTAVGSVVTVVTWGLGWPIARAAWRRVLARR
jgi:hypothetical protein